MSNGSLLLTAVYLSLYVQGPPADEKAKPVEAKPVEAKPAETKRVELHRLTNEELLKQTLAIHEEASRDYLGQLRALASAEALLDEVRKQVEEATVPPPP